MGLTKKILLLLLLGVAIYWAYVYMFAPFIETGRDKVGFFYGNVSAPIRDFKFTN